VAECKNEDGERAVEVSKLISDFAKENEELKKETKQLVLDTSEENKQLIEGFRKESQERATAWKEFLGIVQSGKGIKAAKEVEVPEKPYKEEEVKVKKEEVKVEEKEVPLEDKVLEFIERHPGGLRVGDMEGPLGVPRLKLGRIAKRLLNEGKVRKEEDLYFPL
jgi:hypothetical protein